MVEHISDSIAIMYLGRIVEKGPAERIFAKPAHPYTRALIEAIPVPDPERRHDSVPVRGEAPSPIAPPPGCPFHPRCPYAIAQCREIVPPSNRLETSTRRPPRSTSPPASANTRFDNNNDLSWSARD